jgi:hypothetical protein
MNSFISPQEDHNIVIEKLCDKHDKRNSLKGEA